MNTRYLLISSAIAGTLAALLSNIPFLDLFNCLLCAWMWLGGIFAVWLYRSNTDAVPTGGQALVLGLVTGLVAAAIDTILTALIGINPAPVPPETMQQLEEAFGEGAALLTSQRTALVFNVIISLIFYPLFGAVGAYLGQALFKGRGGTGSPPQV
jgi:hypothetical protein